MTSSSQTTQHVQPWIGLWQIVLPQQTQLKRIVTNQAIAEQHNMLVSPDFGAVQLFKCKSRRGQCQTWTQYSSVPHLSWSMTFVTHFPSCPAEAPQFKHCNTVLRQTQWLLMRQENGTVLCATAKWRCHLCPCRLSSLNATPCTKSRAQNLALTMVFTKAHF